MAIRKIAFVAFVASLLSLLAPSWNLIETMSRLVSRGSFSWWQTVPWTGATWLVAVQNGRTIPPFSGLLQESIRTLASQACLFIAPYVVSKSQPVAVVWEDHHGVLRDGSSMRSGPPV